MNREDFLWKVYSNVNDWIKVSDAKAVAILTALGIISGFSIQEIISIFHILVNHTFPLIASILLFTSIILSAIFSFICLNPYLKNVSNSSSIYFMHIATNYENNHHYQEHMDRNINNDEWTTGQIYEQIFSNSKVAKRKFINVGWSMRFLFLSLFSGLLFLVSISLIPQG